MESALIVSATTKSVAYLSELVSAASFNQVISLPSCGEARRLLLERDFDLVIINAPLKDESGESLARHVATKGMSQVILIVDSEFCEAVSEINENEGILTISKPLDKAIFWAMLKLANVTHNRLRNINAENAKLKQRIEDIRIVDRAKCLLISHLSMSEQDAHRLIEKQAMDLRASKRSIAEGIIKIYEN